VECKVLFVHVVSALFVFTGEVYFEIALLYDELLMSTVLFSM